MWKTGEVVTMAFWSALAQGSIKGLLGGVGSLAKDLRAAITGKEAMSSEQQLELLSQINALEMHAANMEALGAQGQIDLNLVDAKSGSLFKGGWRPAIGWVCVVGLFYTFLLRPLLPWAVEVGALIIGKQVELPVMPSVDMKELMALILSLLGMGGFRMYEKTKGVASR